MTCGRWCGGSSTRKSRALGSTPRHRARTDGTRWLNLRRKGVDNLRDLRAQLSRRKYKAFKAIEPDYLHMDVKYLL